MPISQITIKNYKSLENLTLKMRPFMVFVGPNNAGKSNIFDALRFLSDFVRDGASALRQRGGFKQIVFDGDISRAVSFELHGSLKVEDRERPYRYFLELEGDLYGNYRNREETLSLTEGDEKRLLEAPSADGRPFAQTKTGEQMIISLERDRSYLSQFTDRDSYPILGHFAHEVRNWAIFNLFPDLMRGSLPVRRELRLEPSGRNLAVVLHTLQTEYRQRFKEIEEVLQAAIPELEELMTGLTTHEAGQTFIQIREKGLSEPIPAWGMSDGTLRLLAHLATLYSPSLPPLICFEEPEDYVHPRLLELVVDLLKNASEDTQVLATTHSPYLVDLLEPEDLFIVEKHEGKTQIKKAEDKKGVREALKELTLGDMWYSGSFGGVP